MKYSRREILFMSSAVAAMGALGACSGERSRPTNIDDFDAVETASRIRSKDITAREAVEAAILRAEKVNPKINAIVASSFDQAREAAAQISDGAFAGVPTFVKDLLDVTGQPTGNGSRAFDGHIATAQFPFIDDLFDAGFISIGKSSTPEFGLTGTTEPVSSGITRNPWNVDHSSGGSSGGAAALVAAGVVPLAHASDGGGSIRIPASCCGTVGLKVSNDRYRPARNERNIPVRISVQGCETRTVRDTAAFLAAMEADGTGGPLEPIGLVKSPSKKRLKIGFFTAAPVGVPVETDVVRATEDAARLCESLGHIVEPMETPFSASLAEPFLIYWAAFADQVVTAWEAQNGRAATEDQFEPFTFGLKQHFHANRDKMGDAILKLIGFASAYRNSFGEFDLLLSPVLTAAPPPIGYLGTDVAYDTAIERLSAYAQFTSPANVAGAPSISLPLGWSSDGLPIGAMFNAQVGQERMLLELAFELEQAQGWIDRTPPVFAR